MIRRPSILVPALALALAGWLAAPASRATVITFQTASGATTTGGAVSAQATFTTSANNLQIVLSDELANPTDVGQLVSGIAFTIDGISISGDTLVNGTSQDVSVDGSGHPTLGTTYGYQWLLQPGFDLCEICNGVNAPLGPEALIIGPPASGGNYTAANGSIAGNPAHNPFLNGTATFDVSLAGLEATDTISSATFQFGTNFGSATSTGECTAGCTSSNVPEPGSFALFGAGLLGLAIIAGEQRRRKLRKN